MKNNKVYLSLLSIILSSNLLHGYTQERLDPWYGAWRNISKEADEAAKETAEIVKKASEKTAKNIKRAIFLSKLQGEYFDAVDLAEKLEPKDVSKNLTTIAPWQKELVWNKEKTHIRMVSWIPDWAVNMFYKPKLHQEFTTPEVEGVYMWVTVVPQVKEFAKEYLTHKNKNLPRTSPSYDLDLKYRLQQYFGLPPQDSTYHFVEIWVKPEDLFRPCLDQEVVDSSCVFDPSTHQKIKGYEDMFNFVPADKTYQEWFNKRKAGVYKLPYPFPWTRLGYTYDWGSQTSDKFGISEFAVRQGRRVLIEDIIATDDYPHYGE